jgi:hypothetical protein
VIDGLTFPRYHALRAAWAQVPPLAFTLARVAGSLGITWPKVFGDPANHRAGPRQASGKSEILAAFAAQGMPVFGERPNDPVLDLCGY